MSLSWPRPLSFALYNLDIHYTQITVCFLCTLQNLQHMFQLHCFCFRSNYYLFIGRPNTRCILKDNCRIPRAHMGMVTVKCLSVFYRFIPAVRPGHRPQICPFLPIQHSWSALFISGRSSHYKSRFIISYLSNGEVSLTFTQEFHLTIFMYRSS